MLKKNMGSTDRTIRILVGVLAIVAGIYFKTWWGVLGLIPLVTASVSWCPLYLPFGISTCRTKAKGKAA